MVDRTLKSNYYYYSYVKEENNLTKTTREEKVKVTEIRLCHCGNKDSVVITAHLRVLLSFVNWVTIKVKQQVGIKFPNFRQTAFLGGLFVTTERGMEKKHGSHNDS